MQKITEVELKTGKMMYDLCWPTLMALRGLLGTAGYREINEKVLEETSNMDFSDVEELKYKPEYPRTILEYKLGFARSYLNFAGLVEKSGRGIWSLTARGYSIASEEKTIELCEEAEKRKARENLEKRKARESLENKPSQSQPGKPRDEERADSTEDLEISEEEEERRWQDEIINILCTMDPYAFERFCVELLTKSGFKNTGKTPGTRDGGIDVYGKLRVNLISFKVGVQCKCVKEGKDIPPGEIDKLAGSLKKLGFEKGIFITTGGFSKKAREAAETLNIDLIDRIDICDELERLKLGLKQEIAVDYDFFSKFSAGIKDNQGNK